jgi:hypothetical protein
MLSETEQQYFSEQLAERAMQLAATVARDLGIRDAEECESLALERLFTAIREFDGPADLSEVWRWAAVASAT